MLVLGVFFGGKRTGVRGRGKGQGPGGRERVVGWANGQRGFMEVYVCIYWRFLSQKIKKMGHRHRHRHIGGDWVGRFGIRKVESTALQERRKKGSTGIEMK